MFQKYGQIQGLVWFGKIGISSFGRCERVDSLQIFALTSVSNIELNSLQTLTFASVKSRNCPNIKSQQKSLVWTVAHIEKYLEKCLFWCCVINHSSSIVEERKTIIDQSWLFLCMKTCREKHHKTFSCKHRRGLVAFLSGAKQRGRIMLWPFAR